MLPVLMFKRRLMLPATNLLDKLHQKGLQRRWWKLKEDSYGDVTARMLWEGKLSELFAILQGNPLQGKLPSPDDYLSFLVKNLKNQSRTEMGFHIGSCNI